MVVFHFRCTPQRNLLHGINRYPNAFWREDKIIAFLPMVVFHFRCTPQRNLLHGINRYPNAFLREDKIIAFLLMVVFHFRCTPQRNLLHGINRYPYAFWREETNSSSSQNSQTRSGRGDLYSTARAIWKTIFGVYWEGSQLALEFDWSMLTSKRPCCGWS